jgi:hypothetical protein
MSSDIPAILALSEPNCRAGSPVHLAYVVDAGSVLKTRGGLRRACDVVPRLIGR